MFNLKKINKVVWFFLIVTVFIIFSYTFPYDLYLVTKENSKVSKSELDKLLEKNNYLTLENTVRASNFDDVEDYVVKYNLFNMFNVTSLRVEVVNDNEVLLGGDCIGINLKSKGLQVIGSNYVLTKNGPKNPIAESGLEVGDILLKINGQETSSVLDITNIMKSCKGEKLTLLVKHGESEKEYEITPALDHQSGEYKLGLWVKNDASGVGTLTYVKNDDLRFGALGHSINKGESDEILEISDGQIYKCNVIGVKPGRRGMAGELLGIFSQTNPQGNIDKNIQYGIFGNMLQEADLLINKRNVEVGGKMSARPGRAQIVSTINGNTPEYFDIELIKVNYQSSASEKSMVFRVTDDRLLAKTGGIVQGMSGSPIIQDGKVIGAVTHVFVNDPTKGFGVYIDWMINE